MELDGASSNAADRGVTVLEKETSYIESSETFTGWLSMPG